MSRDDAPRWALHYLLSDSVGCHVLSPASPLRLDARGRRTGAGDWAASLLEFSGGPARRARVALVVRAGARVLLGPNIVPGVAEIDHGDHLFVGETELLLSGDTHPLPVQFGPGTTCPMCCRELPAADGQRMLACPRCRARACEACWRAFPGSRCATAGCEQSASLDRPLWSPGPEEFFSYAGEAERGFAEGRAAPWSP